ncbi:MAG: AAA family ATPase [Clostridiales bacterium]|nr:AAA family ATPase [Clostridiales bacterium]
MKLTKYRVTDFRSVQDSGWIECDDVTTLVGVNESGKSNLLLALWKLNPAREGTIDILHDMPVSKLSALRTKTSQTPFVSAEFAIDEDSAATISQKLNCKCNEGDIVIVTRFYDGKYSVSFPNGKPAYNEDENDDENVEPESDGFVKKYTSEELKNAVIEELPKFVYYSNYGNLSSKIYLPHVVRWLNGETITGVEINEDQVRTLRVLFDFVNLKPEEILELGKDPKVLAIERTGNRNQTPSAEEIKKAEDDKEQRSILLQSASGELTRKFKEWWQQGEYKFRFEADGDYFRIWVSDKLRPDEVGLELRSTGLQWFLSFYLRNL